MSSPESIAREDICRVGNSLFDRGYVHATAGNISVRLEDGFLITPTDACLGFLDPARLAKLDLSGQLVSGDKASKTIALHRRIYSAAAVFDPAVRCIIHTHSTPCVALTLQPDRLGQSAQEEFLPPLTAYFVMKVGHVPLIPCHRPGDPAAADLVSQAIGRYGQRGTPLRAVMLERLGPTVWHVNLAAAMATLEELEETAKLMLACTTPPQALSDAQIDELRQTFKVFW
jgi:ribulose-5-phosphate 4-epimerase/fuculose-1-phosphate aldolase